MAYAYGGCEFVLSVLTGFQADEGFPRWGKFWPVALGQCDVSYGAWSDYQKLYIRRVPRSLETEMKYAPLNQRAWPLQEKVLAPVVVYICQDQLIARNYLGFSYRTIYRTKGHLFKRSTSCNFWDSSKAPS
jgi:hypothetical protein